MSESGTPEAPEICAFADDCAEPVVTTVRTVLGPQRFCKRHGWVVRNIEAEWDQAERDYLEQP